MCHHHSSLCTDIAVSFTSNTYSVHENEGYVRVCIEITSGLLQRAAIVYLSSLDGTALNSSKQLSSQIRLTQVMLYKQLPRELVD